MSSISVLMPIYNCENYLRFTLASLEAQSMSDFEVILVNDGSTDGSSEILLEYAKKDARFKVFSQKNQGIVAALNFGLAQARGKYIARLDGDDIAHPSRLKMQCEYLENNPDSVCVGSLYRTINEKGDLLSKQKYFSNIKQTNLKKFPPHVATLPHPSIMLRRSDLLALCGYRPCFPHAEDYDLFLRLSRIGRIDIIPEYLLDYRVHQSSLSSKNIQIQLDSALKALLAAVVFQTSLKDPFDEDKEYPESPKPNLRELFDRLPNKKTKDYFYFLKDLRSAGGWLNRGEFNLANNDIKALFIKLVTHFFEFYLDVRYWQMLTAMTRMWIKIKLKRI